MNITEVTAEVIEDAIDIVDGWYDSGRVDWENVWDRMESRGYDMGCELDTPAMRKIQREVRKARR